MSRMDADYDNFRAALEWSLAERVDSRLCFRLAWQLAEFWRWRGFLEEGRSHFDKVLARPGLTGLTRERADLLYMNAWPAFHQGDEQALRLLLEDSKAIYQQLGSEGLPGESDALNSLAATEYKFGEPRAAVEHARQALEIVEKIDHPVGGGLRLIYHRFTGVTALQHCPQSRAIRLLRIEQVLKDKTACWKIIHWLSWAEHTRSLYLFKINFS